MPKNKLRHNRATSGKRRIVSAAELEVTESFKEGYELGLAIYADFEVIFGDSDELDVFASAEAMDGLAAALEHTGIMQYLMSNRKEVREKCKSLGLEVR